MNATAAGSSAFGSDIAGDPKGALAFYRRPAERTTNIPEPRYLLVRAARLVS